MEADQPGRSVEKQQLPTVLSGGCIMCKALSYRHHHQLWGHCLHSNDCSSFSGTVALSLSLLQKYTHICVHFLEPCLREFICHFFAIFKMSIGKKKKKTALVFFFFLKYGIVSCWDCFVQAICTKKVTAMSPATLIKLFLKINEE